MEYSNDFKTKCFRVFRWTGRVLELVKALESENHTKIRHLLEWGMEDSSLYGKEIDLMGRAKLRKDKKHTFLDRRKLYSEFMEMYAEHLDKYEQISVN